MSNITVTQQTAIVTPTPGVNQSTIWVDIADSRLKTMDSTGTIQTYGAGAQGPAGPAGPAGDPGPPGATGVVAATAPVTYNSGTQTVGITQATTSTNGYLSSADWNLFNSMQLLSQKNQANGYAGLDANTFVNGNLLNPTQIGNFGGGIDFAATIVSNLTLTTNKYYTNLTINPGVTVITGGNRIFVSGTLTNNGLIIANGANGANATGAAGGGAGGAGTSSDISGGQGGGAGATGVVGAGAQAAATAAYTGAGGNGGGGGTGGNGASGAGGASRAATVISFKPPMYVTTSFLNGVALLGGGSGGTGGSSGAGDGTNAGGGGGGGGAGGGMIAIYAKNLINNGQILARGGNGGNGFSTLVGNTGGGGGGGAGGGGMIYLFYSSLSGSGIINVDAGAIGTGGTGFGTGTAGLPGLLGSAGKIIKFNLTTGAFE